MNDLKRLVYDLMQNEPQQETVVTEPTTSLVLRNLYNQKPGQFSPAPSPTMINHREDRIQDTEAVIEESFSIEEKERELILKALEKITVRGNWPPKTWAYPNEPYTGS